MKNLIVIFFLLVSSTAFSQPIWTQTYIGAGNEGDQANDVAIDKNGNIYVCGYSYVIDSDNEIILIKYSPAGTLLWERKTATPSNTLPERANAIALDTAGNIYMVGLHYFSSFPSGFITKYDPQGNRLWFQVFDRVLEDDELYAVVVDDSMNSYVTGYSEGLFYGADLAIAKYNPDGIQKWVRYYTNPLARWDVGYDLEIDKLGNLYVAGMQTDSTNSDRREALVIKYDNAGTLQWKGTYRSSAIGYTLFNSIDLDEAGNVYVGGYSTENTPDNWDILFAKYSNSGNREWLKTITENPIDQLTDVKVDHNSNLYITGALGFDMITAKYNTTEDEIWRKLYNGPGNTWDKGNEIVMDNSGNVYIAGTTNQPNHLSDALIISYSLTGTQRWSHIYSGSSNRSDEFKGIALDSTGGVVAAGFCKNNGDLYSDLLVAKYNQTVGITPVSSTTPTDYSLEQNYPNPFNPMTKIKFDIPKAFNTKLAVYDILGKEVAVLVNDNLKPGSYEVEFSASDLPSGTYFYRLSSGDFTEVKKMMLLK
jgi:uncharacterized delta-60 repeat protein